MFQTGCLLRENARLFSTRLRGGGWMCGRKRDGGMCMFDFAPLFHRAFQPGTNLPKNSIACNPCDVAVCLGGPV
jgi:hypothetical protein